VGSWTGLLPSRPAWDQRAARKSSQVANRSGTAPPSPQGVDEDSPYVLRGLENRKTQLERLTGGLVLEPHPRLFYQDQSFEPPNTYRGLENEKRQKEISSLVGRCCQTFWDADIQPSRPAVFFGEGFLPNSLEGRTTSGVGRWMTIPPPLPFIFLMDRRLVEIRGAKRGG